ncbi:hypothetical protein EDB92DRAFT_442069 [Lactarius akahatsu]|uniref:Uncharacterized protein n=1 Tax=Lactarius akahatsu TaxID=416441 RepID=A0AAD4QED7_9AGAM|nr:hypothetical protein EDB92DRAFT_442069 [Lactarius akahatsu]
MTSLQPANCCSRCSCCTRLKPPSIMGTKTWLLPVDHTFQTTIGSRFSVLTSGEEDVETLREKVMEKKQNNPAFTYVSASDLSVWKTKGELVINKVTIKESLADILSGIDVHNKDTIEELDEDEQVADLELSEGQILLIRLPGASPLLLALAPAFSHGPQSFR